MTPTRLPRLSAAVLARVPAASRPAYDREGVEIGVVHLGPGAFFRAHQAPVYERLLAAGDRRWGVCGVSLHSAAVRDALQPQDGLYTLVRLGDEAPPQVVGALREVLVAPERPEAVRARLAAPATRVVALTVTEKGHHLRPDGDLDLDDAAVRNDLAATGVARTVYGWLAAALEARRAARTAPFLLLSCDNLPGNGSKLKRALAAFVAARGEADLARWIEREVAAPDAMVDSITPATDDALRLRVATAMGFEDAWPVQREPFAQWVVAAVEHPALAALAQAGVTLTADVPGYERAKLRLLNGAHSTLAYLGLLAGCATVAEAMAEPRLAAFTRALMRRDLLPAVRPPAGLDGEAYAQAVLDRFRNGAVRHRLAQIAADGSQKLPIRLGAPALEACAAGAPPGRFAVPFAAWMRWTVHQVRTGAQPQDPAAENLKAAVAACSGEPAVDVDAFLTRTAAVPHVLARDPAFRAALVSAYAGLDGPDRLAGLRDVTA